MRIAIWYHCILRGSGINEEHAIAVLQSQMNALRESGLGTAAREIHIGVNGTDSDALTVMGFNHWPKTRIYSQPDGKSELATLHHLQPWLRPGWFVFYHHIKGVQYPGNPVWERWRKCMEKACVWNWEECVSLLAKGCDTVGAHWMDSIRYPIIPASQRYWGGNFWWARSEYLMTLPPLKPDSRDNRYEAEAWIGQGKKKPSVYDFARHFPMNCPA